MIKFLTATALLFAPLVACGQPEGAAREEGVYGASSGANPNLADLQEPPVDPANEPRPDEAPASPGEATYPSGAAQTPPPPIGGRGSAQTGATDGQN